MAKTHRKAAKRKRAASSARTLNWDKRYGNIKKYKRNAAIAHRATNNLCCICLTRPSNQIHHAAYGRDEIGKTTFPVCEECHSAIAHDPSNWVRDLSNPVWNNCNTPAFTKRLQLGYQLLYGGVK